MDTNSISMTLVIEMTGRTIISLKSNLPCFVKVINYDDDNPFAKDVVTATIVKIPFKTIIENLKLQWDITNINE